MQPPGSTPWGAPPPDPNGPWTPTPPDPAQAAPPPPPGYGQPAAPPPPPGYGQPAAPPPPPGYGQPAAPPPPPGYDRPTTPAAPGAPVWSAPTPAPGYPAAPPTSVPPGMGVPPGTPPPVPINTKRRNRILVGVGATVVLGLVGLALVAILGAGGGGADSAEDAVRDLAAAIDQEDSLAAIATLNPAEVRSLADLSDRVGRKARELDGREDSSDDVDPALQGLDVTIEDLELDTVELAPDVVRVEITDGTLEWEVDADEALGGELGSGLDWMAGGASAGEVCSGLEPDEYDECIEDMGGVSLDTEGEVDFGDERRRASRRDDPGVFAVAIERDGGWYVSPFFTAAEYARLANGGDDDDLDPAPEPAPAAESPTAAVEALAAAVEDRDASDILDTLAAELDVLRVYGDLGDEVDDVLADDEMPEITVDIKDTTEEEIDDDRVRVVLDRVDITVEYYDEDWEEDITTEVEIDGDCISWTSDNPDWEEPDGETCLSEVGGGVVKALGVDRISLVAVAERDGWTVSPIESVLDPVRSVVDRLTQPLIDRLTVSALGTVAEELLPDREPSATLGNGANRVELDEAGVGLVEVDPGGELVRVTSDDDDAQLQIADVYEGDILAGDEVRRVVVLGRIGESSVEVRVDPLETEDVSSATGTLEGELDDGEYRAVRIPEADISTVVVTSGYDLVQDAYDEDGQTVWLDSGVPTTDDGDEVTSDLIVVFRLSEDAYGDIGENRFRVEFLPAAGGFAGPDPAATSVTMTDYGEGSVYLQLVEDQPVDVTISSPVELNAYSYCDPLWDADEDDIDITVDANSPTVMHLEPSESGPCRISLSAYDMPGDEDVTIGLSLVPSLPR